MEDTTDQGLSWANSRADTLKKRVDVLEKDLKALRDKVIRLAEILVKVTS